MKRALSFRFVVIKLHFTFLLTLVLGSSSLLAKNICMCDPASDSLVLVEFYTETDGANWQNNTWDLSQPMNSWAGVTTNADGCVTSLVKSSFDLEGTLLDLNLPELTNLQLGGNNLTGSIPDFSNLPNLTNLGLSSNNLTGSIPDFSNLPELTSLGLRLNNLTGSIPNFSDLPELVVFDLGYNNLTGSIPDFSNLLDLTNVTLRNNDLNGCFPSFVCNVSFDAINNPSLPWQGVHINFCNGQSQIGALCDDGDANSTNDQIGGFPNCSCTGGYTNSCVTDSLELIAFYNATDGPNWGTNWDLSQPMNSWPGVTTNGNGCVIQLILETFGIAEGIAGGIESLIDLNLPELEILDLSINPINGTIPNFTNLPKLKELYLVTCSLQGEIPNFENSPLLSHIHLGDNSLTGSIPDFSNHTLLSEIFLGFNNLTGSIPDLTSLDSLHYVDLGFNNLSGPIPNIALTSGSLGIGIFLCNNNQLTGNIPAFENSTTLINFECSNNQLTGNIPNLDLFWSIGCSYNQLSGCFPDEVCSMNFYSDNNPSLPWQGDITNFCNGQPQVGVPCDDGDPNTINDQIGSTSNCLCSGIPTDSCINDSLALVDFYNATDGPNWQFSWNLLQPMSTWEGVLINETGCVVELTLIGNILNGTLIDLNLPELESLDLSTCGLDGTIPNFSNLPKLNSLNLFTNNFYGEIPNFDNSPLLTQVLLLDNNLTGTIPDFNHLTNLSLLALDYNNLSGCFPPFICTLDQFSALENPLMPWQGDHTLYCSSGLAQIAAPCDNGDASTTNDQILGTNCQCADSNILTIDIKEVTSNTNSNICVPFEVSNFDQMVTFQFVVKYDITNLQFTNANSFLSDFDINSYAETAPGTINFSWAAITNGSESLSPGSSIFELCFDKTNSLNGYINYISFDFGFSLIEISDVNGVISNPTLLDGSITCTDPNSACTDQNAGEVQQGVFTGNSNDTAFPRVFLCFNDIVEIDHIAGSENLSGDPDLGTPAGIGYALYQCPPTFSGPSLDLILTDPCIQQPLPPTGNPIWITFGDTTAGDMTFSNEGIIQNQFGSNGPSEVWFAPITIDDFQNRSYESDGSGSFGPCTNVRIDQAFSVVYLNEITISNLSILGTNGSFNIEGGMPEFDGTDYTSIDIVNDLDPTIIGAVTSNNISHGDIVNFTIPQEGNYNIIVTDSKGCDRSILLDMPNDNLNLVGVTTSASCYGDTNGALEIMVSGGIPPYQYTYINVTDPTDTGSGLINVFGGNANITGLPGGSNYQIVITDSSNPTELTTNSFFTIPEPSQIGGQFASLNPNCPGDSNGVIDLIIFYDGFVVNLPDPAFSLIWNTGATTSTISNLPAGAYNVVITHLPTGCNSSEAVFLENGEPDGCTNPAACNYDANAFCDDGSCVIETTCDNDPCTNGGIYIWNNITCDCELNEPTVTGCTDPNSLNYDSLANCSDPIDCDCIDLGTCNDGICSNGIETWNPNTCECETTTPPTINPGITTSNPSCEGLPNGMVIANPTNGAVPYNFIWETNTNNPNFPSTNATIDNLDAGTYYVTISDTNGCETIDSIDINYATILEVNAVVEDISCFGINDGIINLTPTAIGLNNGDYSFNWSDLTGGGQPEDRDELVANNYEVTITDAIGCSVVETFELIEPTQINANLQTTDMTCEGLIDGSSMANPIGGMPPFNYNWDSANGNPNLPSTNSEVNNLEAGIYYVTISDDNSCSIVDSINIGTTTIIESNASIEHVSCYNSNDGSVVVNPSAIGINNGGYSFDWGDLPGVANPDNRMQLSGGNYSLTMTDAAGCTLVETFEVNEPNEIAINLENITLESCQPGSDGSISLNVSGGAGSFNYNWNTPSNQNTATPTNLPAGAYTVTVTDANMCTDTFSATIASPPGIPELDLIVQNISCIGMANGSAIAEIISDSPTPLTFELNGISYETENDFFDLTPGSYDLKVTDAFGCQTDTTFSITEPTHQLPDLGADLFVTNGETIQLNAGVDADSYSWTPNSGNALDCTDCKDPIARPNRNGATNDSSIFPFLYTVTTTIDGCNYTDSIIVNVRPSITTTTIITINGDGLNDVFVIPQLDDSIPDPDSELLIFNRWGEIVFEKKPYDNTWEGSDLQDKLLPEGTYYYIIRLNIEEGIIGWGNVVIIREK